MDIRPSTPSIKFKVYRPAPRLPAWIKRINRSDVDAEIAARMTMNGPFGFRLKRYPMIVGVKRFMSEDRVIDNERVLALALSSTESIWFTRRVLDMEYAEVEYEPSKATESSACGRKPLGEFTKRIMASAPKECPANRVFRQPALDLILGIMVKDSVRETIEDENGISEAKFSLKPRPSSWIRYSET